MSHSRQFHLSSRDGLGHGDITAKGRSSSTRARSSVRDWFLRGPRRWSDASSTEPGAPRRRLERPEILQRCSIIGLRRAVRDDRKVGPGWQAGLVFGQPEMRRSVTHRIAVDGAQPSRARQPEAKRADQGGVVRGNPSDAFLTLGVSSAPGTTLRQTCPDKKKNAAGNCSRRRSQFNSARRLAAVAAAGAGPS